MTLSEYIKAVSPGNRVYVLHQGHRMYATAGNLYSKEGIQPALRFDSGQTALVSEKNVHLLHLEPLN